MPLLSTPCPNYPSLPLDITLERFPNVGTDIRPILRSPTGRFTLGEVFHHLADVNQRVPNFVVKVAIGDEDILIRPGTGSEYMLPSGKIGLGTPP